MAEKKSTASLKLILVITLSALFVSGWSAINIIHYYIEDIYYEPLIYRLFSRGNYASEISWFLVSTAIFVLAQLSEWHLIKKAPSFRSTRWYRFSLNTLMVCFGLISTFIIVAVLYSFFDGKSSWPGLLRVFASLSLIAMGALYCFCALSDRIYNSKLYKIGLIGFVGVLIFSMMFILMKQASPDLVRTYRKDIEKTDKIRNYARDVLGYFEKHAALPTNFKKMKQEGMEYRKSGQKTFSICAEFSDDFFKARRLEEFRNSKKIRYKKGKHCQLFFIKQNKGGNPSLHRDGSNPNLDVGYLEDYVPY